MAEESGQGVGKPRQSKPNETTEIVAAELIKWLVDLGWTPPSTERDLVGDGVEDAEDDSNVRQRIQVMEELPSVRSLAEDLAVARVRAMHAADNDELLARSANAARASAQLMAEIDRSMEHARAVMRALGPVPPSTRPDTHSTRTSELQKELEQLQQALVTRPLVARAVGIVMAILTCDADQALAVLIVWSQTTNTKLREIATRVAESTAAGQLDPTLIRGWYTKAVNAGRISGHEGVASPRLGATERPPDAERLLAAADREERLAVVQEQTEQTMHAVADMLPNPARVHERAHRLTERASEHAKRAAELRDKAKPD